MKIRMLVICVLLLCMPIISFPQENNIKVYDPDKAYVQEEVDSILLYFRLNARKIKDYSDLKKILESNKSLTGWTYYYFLKSKQYNLAGIHDSALIYADKAVVYFEGLENKRNFEERVMLETYLYKARSLSAFKRYNESIINNQKALDLANKYPDYKWKSFIVASIAGNHLEIGNDSIALDYYLKTSRDSLYMTLDRPAVTTYTRIGEIYRSFNDLDSATKYYKKGIERSELGVYKNNLWALYYDVGRIYRKNKNIDSTLFFYKKSIQNFNDQIFTQTPPEDKLSYLTNYIEVHEGDIDNAIIEFNKLLTKYQKNKNLTKEDKGLIIDIYDGLTIAYIRKNNIEGLEKVIQGSNTFLESFYKNQLKINLDNLEVKYQTKEKDNSIANLEEETKNQQIIIKQRNAISWVLGGLLLSFISLGFLFYRQRQLQNKYRASNLEQRLLRSQLNPHFLFNALNSVSSLVQKKSDQTIPYISKLGNLLRSILENSREEFITLEEEVETLSNYLELQSDFSKKFSYTIKIDESLDRDEVLIPPMFIQPFVENAIVHGLSKKDNGVIEIQIAKEDASLCCYIKDNGIGYSESIKNKEQQFGHKSLSGKILKERLALYAKSFKAKASYVIEDITLGRGTKVMLWLPYLKDE